jgi:hypothetical protein
LLYLLVEVGFKMGQLQQGSGCLPDYEQRREFAQRLRVFGINFDINIGRAALE